MQNSAESILTVEGFKRLSLSGVESVDGFSENEIRLTVSGKRVRISGAHLKVLAFSKTSGAFSAAGDITSLKVGAGRGKLFERLFK